MAVDYAAEVHLLSGSGKSGIELRQGTDTMGGGGGAGGGLSRRVYNSQSVLVFKDGTEEPLENQQNRSVGVGLIGNGNVMFGGKGRELAISKQVADFLNIPFQEV